ncbi:transposable element Tcb1 transposase [Trichonephila clavipes]|nr:transposable element Tcb1 transposase [Trichonephila clavipes]
MASGHSLPLVNLSVQGGTQGGREIGQRVGRKQVTVMRICHRWMPEETMDRWGRLHPPRCTTVHDDRRIVRRAQSEMSAKRSLLHLPLTGSYRRLRRQWCDERWIWRTEWNDIVFTTTFCLKHSDGRIRVWRLRSKNCCVMHRHTSPAPGIMIELLLWPACSPDLRPFEKKVVHASTTTGPLCKHGRKQKYPLLHEINFGNMWKPHGLLYPKDTSKASLVLYRRVRQWV